MKNLLSVIICSLVFCVLLAFKIYSGGRYQNGLADENLKGKVKSCIWYTYLNRKAEKIIDTGWDVKETEIFNNDGHITARIVIIKHRERLDHQSGTFFIYDHNNRLIATKNGSGKIVSRIKYSFNKDNNLVETQPYSKIVYNKQGLQDTSYNYGDAGKVQLKTSYRYNKANDLIEMLQYDPSGKIDEHELYFYDSHHHKIKEKNSSANWGNSMTLYAYDEFGNMTMEIDSNVTYIGGAQTSTSTSGNNIIIFKNKYSNFDSHNNWRQWDMLPNKNNPKTSTVKREITYYAGD